jgi:hypothetical protein
MLEELFFQVTTPQESSWILLFILKLPRLNPRFFIGQQQGMKPLQQFTHNELNISSTGIEHGWGG